VKGYNQILNIGVGEAEQLHRLAQAVLQRYGLSVARSASYEDAGSALFRVVLVFGEVAHPYLGRLSQQRLALHVYSDPNQVHSEVIRILEMGWDEGAPEPVPACDGSLVVEVPVEGLPAPMHCVLLRWVEAEFFMVRLGRDSEGHPNRVEEMVLQEA
jgi:hypothetical protein